MRTRPRYGAEGFLLRATDVAVVWEPGPGGRPWIVGDHGAGLVPGRPPFIDPYARVAGTDLLLAEDLARSDLGDPAAAVDWCRGRGSLSLWVFWGDQGWPAERPAAARGRAFADPLDAVVTMQASVRWFIDAIARLSGPADAFDPAWTDIVIEGPEGWVRASCPPGAPCMRLEPVPGRPGDLPLVRVPPAAWERTWAGVAAGEDVSGPIAWGASLTADRAGLLELARRLLEPWLKGAAPRSVSLGYEHEGGPLRVDESEGVWWSVLAPITMQLLEGLRRASEGLAGGAACRECGRAFLALDARRTGFCTDAERNRFSQRLHRQRVAAGRRTRDDPDAAGDAP